MIQQIRFIAKALWRWDVVAIGSTLLYSFGVGAMYGDDYIVATVLFFAGTAWLTARVLAWEETKNHPQRRGISILILIIAVGVLSGSLLWIRLRKTDHAQERAENTQPPPSGQPGIAETAPPNKPDTLNAIPATPKDPTKKKIRQAIGDLIQEGTKIRDKAPVWVGEAPPDITNEWEAWTSKVQKFLGGNFDSAEVEKFRSLDDPEVSLNSKIHAEIGYLEKLLELPELQP